jgi:hypothetical protein
MCGLNLPNGFTATVVTIRELVKGKGLLVMQSWMLVMLVIAVSKFHHG